MKTAPRDVLAERLGTWMFDEPHNNADRLIMDLYNAGFEVVEVEPEWEPTDDMLLRFGQAHASCEDFTASITYLSDMLKAMHREGLL